MAPKRAVIRIQFDAAAKAKLDELCRKKGMTQISVTSRLLQWFCHQDEVVQSAILGTMSAESLSFLAKRLLEQIARKKAN